MFTYSIEYTNNFDSELDESRKKVSKKEPVMGILWEHHANGAKMVFDIKIGKTKNQVKAALVAASPECEIA
jgi:hypothetical protein